MPGPLAMEVPARPRGAALVSVDGPTYPLESARVTATASGGIALSTLIQSYRNPYAEALEVVYTLPLPADGAVVGYTMRLGDRVIRGEVRRRDEARAEFERAIFEGRTAALLEQDRDDTFTQRLGSLPAGQSAEITIEVLHPLAFLIPTGDETAQWEYRFPTVVGVRYHGAEGRVEDAGRLDVDRAGDSGGIPTRIELSLTVTGGARAEVRRVEAMPLDRDLVVRFPAAGAQIGAHLIEGPGLPGDSGRYGLLTITPPAAPETAFARDLTILLDASGSMSGQAIAWAKELAAELLRSLAPTDRFEIIAFASQPRALTNGPVLASDEALRAGLRELARVQAGGGTEMVDAVIAALHPLRDGSQHQVVLITDGQIGFEDEVVARIVQGLEDGARLHVVGVGAAPNRTLTARAARAGRGVESFVCGDGEISSTVRRLIAATARPVLTDIRIESAAVKGVAPARPRDLLAGQPLVVALELAGQGGALVVSGRLAGQSSPWTWSVDVPPLAERKTAIVAVPLGALYGRETIADLELARDRSDERVTVVALRHRIASRMTSLIAISEEPSVDPREPRRRERLPVEVPAYQSAERLGLRMMRMNFVASGEVSRASSILQSLASFDVKGAAKRVLHQKIDRAEPHDGMTLLTARVLAVQGDLLVIEYESPDDGFIAPVDGGTLKISGWPKVNAVFAPDHSSPKGPHAKGLLLRIALRCSTGSWQDGDNIVMAWGAGAMFVINVAVPKQAGRGDRSA